MAASSDIPEDRLTLSQKESPGRWDELKLRLFAGAGLSVGLGTITGVGAALLAGIGLVDRSVVLGLTGGAAALGGIIGILDPEACGYKSE